MVGDFGHFHYRGLIIFIGALQETVLRIVASDPASLIPFLLACPPGHLGRKARNSAIEALYAQKNFVQSLEWLSRMAVESENLGPLVCLPVTHKDNERLPPKKTQNVDVLVKLAKIAGKQVGSHSPALILWKKAMG